MARERLAVLAQRPLIVGAGSDIGEGAFWNNLGGFLLQILKTGDSQFPLA